MARLFKKRKRLLVGLLIAIFISTLFCLFFYFDLFHITQLRSGDFLFRATGLNRDTETDGRIIIVAIDDRSLKHLGHLSSWSRSHYARIIDTLNEAQARVIVFDILFPDSAQGDDKLLNSITNSGNVILPIVYTPSSINSAIARQIYQGHSFTRPLDIFESEAIAVGHANVSPDADGVVRRLSIAIPNVDKYEPALALASVAVYLRRPEVIESALENNGLPFAGRFIPTSGDNKMLINYVSNSRMTGKTIDFKTLSFVDVLNGSVDPALIRDKIVIIGATASGLADYFWTPLGLEMNGAEIHASAINTILKGNFLKPPPETVTMASVILLALLCGLIVSSLRTLRAGVTAVLLCVAYFLAAFSFFDSGIMLNMLYPPLAVASTFVGVNLYNVISEQSERRQITKVFGCYVSPPVLNKILVASGEHELKLGGEEHEVTTLFADVRNFTGISDKTESQKLIRVLNLYLTIIIEYVLKYDGIINKFGGDSVMAIWNVPVECERHALLATEAAVSAQQAIKERQKKETGLLKMEFGIGVNTGKAVAGNMGSKDRLEYSVIGNAVNLAAKIADATPGGKVWIGNNTFDQVKDNITAISLEPLTIKGKHAPIRVYEVVDLTNMRWSPSFRQNRDYIKIGFRYPQDIRW